MQTLDETNPRISTGEHPDQQNPIVGLSSWILCCCRRLWVTGKLFLETLLCPRAGTGIRIPSPGAPALPNHTWHP